MQLEEILKELEYNRGYFPTEAVQQAVAHREEITPHLLEIMEDILANGEARLDEEEEYFAHIYAVHLLAQFRESRAYPLVLQLIRLSDDLTTDLFSEDSSAIFGRALASTCDGDVEPIKKLIEDAEVEEFAKWGCMTALVVMVNMGTLSREDAMVYLGELLRSKLQREPSYAWVGLVSSCRKLYPGEVYEDIMKAYEEGLVNPGSVGPSDVEASLSMGMDQCMKELASDRHAQPIDDTVKELEWWASFKPEEERGADASISAPPVVQASPAPQQQEYVKEPAEPFRRTVPKVARNSPCPCGSGRKFKKCCGAKG